MERMDYLESISTRCATMASHVRCVGGHMLNTKVLVFERERESNGSEKKEKNKDTNTEQVMDLERTKKKEV